MGLVDKALWENRYADPEAIEAELRGPKGHGWLKRWLPARPRQRAVPGLQQRRGGGRPSS
jgi:hypothetical protein